MPFGRHDRLALHAALALSLLCPVARGDASQSFQWSGELRNLQFATLQEQEIQKLGAEYAKDVADALGLDPSDITDLQGHPGQVSLGSPEGQAAVTEMPTTEASTTTTTMMEVSTEVTTEVPTEASTTVVVATTLSPEESKMPAMSPLRGIAYGALPCTTQACKTTGPVSEDMLQDAYSKQWGADGRDDLGTISKLGANAVRLYHSMGLNVDAPHGGFLDRAQELSLNVMPGYHTELAHSGCPKFDCYDAWKNATLQGFKLGLKQGDRWHPAISALILLNEPDFFASYGQCQPEGSAWCRVKAMLSALDGVLAAEREAGVQAGRVKLTVTWSFGMMPSIDGKEGGAGLFGFQDTVAGIADPSIAHYTPRSSQADLEHAFKTRWVHGVNTQAPWSFVKSAIAQNYAKFAPIPWFIGEYGANGQTEATIRGDLDDMQRTAQEDGSYFMGAAFFQFQTAHFKGGAETNFGLFRLGSDKIGEIHAPNSAAWPVYCLSDDLNWLPGTLAHRAKAVATAWHGSVEGKGLCQETPKTTSTKATTQMTTAVTVVTTSRVTTPAPTVKGGLPAMAPLRGICYGALPCKTQDCLGRVSEDMLQEAYSTEWGAGGRDDLGTMSRLGANAVRLYHSLGLDVEQPHGGFLDRAQAVGLNVMPGYHTELVNTGCPKFDCYDAWKKATLQGFQFGFRHGDEWHPAISALILLNEPDFLGSNPMCQPSGAWCRVKAFLSALDGVLAAEKEAGVKPGRVKLTVTWSFGMMPSIDGKEGGPGLFGFQDTVAGIADPSIAHYIPRSSRADLEHAFKTRWVHGVNTQAPWSFVKSVIASKYESMFAPTPWFIGEYGANGQPFATIKGDLEDMQQTAEEEGSSFLGAAFFQFQTAYFKGGAEKNFGLFSLGSEKIGEIHPPCKGGHCPAAWPVHCLSTHLSWIPGTAGDRAKAVAAAWQGSLEGHRGFCQGGRRLSAVATTIACKINSVAAGVSTDDVTERLEEQGFKQKLLGSTAAVLGDSSKAILGDLSVESSPVVTSEDQGFFGSLWFKRWLPFALIGLFLMVAALALCGFALRRQKRARQLDSNEVGSSAV